MSLSDSSLYDEVEADDLDVKECGEDYDHELRKVAETIGGDVYECLECGAEIIE